MDPLCRLSSDKEISGDGKGPCVIPGMGGRGWCWQSCTEGVGERSCPKQMMNCKQVWRSGWSGQGKELEFAAVDVYGSASGAHIYGSTNLLLDSDAAINIFISPEPCSVAWAEMCSKCRHPCPRD